MVGATFFALFIGNLSSILINVDVAQKKYAEILNQVVNFEFADYTKRVKIIFISLPYQCYLFYRSSNT